MLTNNFLKKMSSSQSCRRQRTKAKPAEITENRDRAAKPLIQELSDTDYKMPMIMLLKSSVKINPDNKTVAAVDLVVPQAGELMGGSQREEDLDKLLARMEEMGVDATGIDWYLDTRRYGGCVHSGFGMGFERLIMYLTGIDNIRDSIPFPRTPKNCEF